MLRPFAAWLRTASRSVRLNVDLLDRMMSGMSDMVLARNELARRLRTEPGLDRPVLIAATGYGQEQDRRKSAEAGFDHHLVKPINTDSLLDLLGHIEAA